MTTISTVSITPGSPRLPNTTTPPVPLADSDPHARDNEMPRWQHAHVAWFNAEKGFGFLTPDTGPAVFVDYGVIEVPGYATLTAGQPVIFTAVDTPRGPEATRVVPYLRTSAAPSPRDLPRAQAHWPRCRAGRRAA